VTLHRAAQGLASFVPGDPHSGYYNDLRVVIRDHNRPAGGRELVGMLTTNRRLANPVSVAQLGLGAWQLSLDDPGWVDTVAEVAGWLTHEMKGDGRLRYHFPMMHTYRLDPGWSSAMAQGEAASLLVRAARTLGDDSLTTAAVRAVHSIVDPTSDLVVETPHGPVLQEYPTSPPSHVLNGWIFALWGIFDVAAVTGDRSLLAAYDAGVAALIARLPMYSTGWSWSRYDLYPHRLANIASPFYHRMHIDQLRALGLISPRHDAGATVLEWQRGMENPIAELIAVARKVAFRALVPRRQRRGWAARTRRGAG
jgi:heparosan-N-sulfate-glucuronate 5-epimerase